jgi:Rps23 Pro-64 3,4-dihydroxylase Tpa1-like proline 4-hydroxylase
MDDGSMQLCSRNIACIYYLTKDWTAADGGLLIDHEAPGGPQTHVPAFNRCGTQRTLCLSLGLLQ